MARARSRRCNSASVPTIRSTWARSTAGVSAETSSTARRASARSSSAMRAMPGRRSFSRRPPHSAQTTGRLVPSTGHTSRSSSGWVSAAPQASQAATEPQLAQPSNRDRPLRLRMHAIGPSPRTMGTSSSDSSPGRSWVRMSTTSTTGQALRSADRSGTRRRSARSSASSDGDGEASTQGMLSRRARSMATSRACHDGVRSSLRAGSCSSRTTMAARSGTGAHAATLVPTVTAPRAARSHCSGYSATGRPDSRRMRTRRWRCATVGTITRVGPWVVAARARRDPSSPGVRRKSVRPENAPASASSASGDRSAMGGPTSVTIVGGDATRRKWGSRPAQRQLAHSPSAITSDGGPTEESFANGRISTPDVGSTLTAVTQPPVRRPWKSIRTSEPGAMRSARPSANQASGTA